MKYYWLTYFSRLKVFSGDFNEIVIKDQHPFEWKFQEEKKTRYVVILLNWKEITEEEYNLFKKKFEHET